MFDEVKLSDCLDLSKFYMFEMNIDLRSEIERDMVNDIFKNKLIHLRLICV